MPDWVWIGHAGDLRDVQATLAVGVRAVVDLADSEPAIRYPRDVIYCRLPLIDGAGNAAVTIQIAAQATALLIRAKLRVMVACSAGLSRSVAIVAAAYAQVDGRSPDDVLRQIASSGPSDLSPALWSEIKRADFSDDTPIVANRLPPRPAAD